MSISRQSRNTIIYIGFLLLSVGFNSLTYSDIAVVDTLMCALHDLIQIGLLLFWLQSVITRLPLSGERARVIAIAYLMLSYLLLRITKYNILAGAVSQRYAVYAYWVPQMLIPSLFLMTCLSIRRSGQKTPAVRRYLPLLPGTILALLAMTNDLHGLVYRPQVDLSVFRVNTGTYTLGPVFYLMYVWMILAALGGLALLFRETGRRSSRVIWGLLAVVLAWYGMVLESLLLYDRGLTRFHLLTVPESHIFGMLGVLEICIRARLLPSNENYPGFFRCLNLPAVITDRRFHAVYRTAADLPAAPEQLRAALSSPVELPADRKLYGHGIRAGYVFWAEDEAAVRRAQERLREANSVIEQENDLIRAETEQKQKDAYLSSRHHIYHEIARELYPCQQRISRILDGAVPGTDSFREAIALVSVLNAYVKRKTNLHLLAAEHDALSTRELGLALQESAGCLTLAGLSATAAGSGEATLPAGQIIALYDTFEALAEQLLGKASSLMVSRSGGSLRLAARTDLLPQTEGLPLPVKLRREDDILYMDVLPAEGGDAA